MHHGTHTYTLQYHYYMHCKYSIFKGMLTGTYKVGRDSILSVLNEIMIAVQYHNKSVNNFAVFVGHKMPSQ